jgi:hypothetical protein
MAYTTAAGPPVSRSRKPAAMKAAAISSRRGPDFVVTVSAKVLEVPVVQVSIFDDRRKSRRWQPDMARGR